jgi:hypothetical protein
MKNSLIFIFTKDRPIELRITLNTLNNSNFRIFVIDDSFCEQNIFKNKELIQEYKHTTYFGNSELNNALKSLNINQPKYNQIFRPLGVKEWNLGYARNSALLVSIIENADKVMFVDDDITIPDIRMLFDSFQLLEQYDVVGANILGMIDDSIIGHISNELNFIDTDGRMLSAGFLAFNLKKIKYPFLNIYNEDWIWLFMQPDLKKHLQPVGVFQKIYDPFVNFESKIVFQEIGELFITGLFSLKDLLKLNELLTNEFWENSLHIREKYLIELLNIAKCKERHEFVHIITFTINNMKKIDNTILIEICDTFFKIEPLFDKLLNLKKIKA